MLPDKQGQVIDRHRPATHKKMGGGRDRPRPRLRPFVFWRLPFALPLLEVSALVLFFGTVQWEALVAGQAAGGATRTLDH